MTKKAYLVVGPESSGTRLMTRLLIEAGCIGQASHNQPLDQVLKGKADLSKHSEESRFVFRRSVPHAGHMPDLSRIDTRFRECGCQTFWIVMFREWAAMARSKVHQGHQNKREDAECRVVPQLTHIFRFLVEHRPDFIIIDSSLMFIAPERALKQLEAVTGFNFRKEIINDADAKHYPKQAVAA